MHFVGPLALIVGSLVAMSGFIISKKPEAKDLFAKIAPYQGFLGVFLLFWGLYDLWHLVITNYGPIPKSAFGLLMMVDKFTAILLLVYIICEILLGFMLGFGLIASWIPGEGKAETKGLEIQKKLLGFSLPVGIVGLISAALWLVKSRGGGL